jgi:hypothetical protein
VITNAFHVRSEADLKHALWLMGSSYVRYALKISTDPDRLLEQETERLHLIIIGSLVVARRLRA